MPVPGADEEEKCLHSNGRTWGLSRFGRKGCDAVR